MAALLFTHYPYIISFLLMSIGLYAIITRRHLVKKLIGLALFQTSALLFFIAMAVVGEGSAPIYKPGVTLYHNPLPHVLMLTAIVVGVATLAVGLAIAVRIKEQHHTVDEEDLLR